MVELDNLVYALVNDSGVPESQIRAQLRASEYVPLVIAVLRSSPETTQGNYEALYERLRIDLRLPDSGMFSLENLTRGRAGTPEPQGSGDSHIFLPAPPDSSGQPSTSQRPTVQRPGRSGPDAPTRASGVVPSDQRPTLARPAAQAPSFEGSAPPASPFAEPALPAEGRAQGAATDNGYNRQRTPRVEHNYMEDAARQSRKNRLYAVAGITGIAFGLATGGYALKGCVNGQTQRKGYEDAVANYAICTEKNKGLEAKLAQYQKQGKGIPEVIVDPNTGEIDIVCAGVQGDLLATVKRCDYLKSASDQCTRNYAAHCGAYSETDQMCTVGQQKITALQGKNEELKKRPATCPEPVTCPEVPECKDKCQYIVRTPVHGT